MRYQPPETATQASLPECERRIRSRLYDIWSFGCITLEFVIWLLYGRDHLRTFNDSNHGEHGDSDMYYEVIPGKGATVHGVVKRWMHHMAKDELCRPGNTALGDLLETVRTGLLIVELPDGGGSEETHSQRPFAPISGPKLQVTAAGSTLSSTLEGPSHCVKKRWRAIDLKIRLRQIASVTSEEAYWYQDRKRRDPPVDPGKSPLVSVPASATRPESTLGLLGRPRTDYGQAILDPED